MRTPSILAATTLVASSLAAGLVGSAGPAAAAGVAWCDPVSPAPPCISSLTINGVDMQSSPDWGLIASTYSVDGSDELAVNLVRIEDGSWDYELGEASLDDDVEIKVLVGGLVPRLVSGKAKDTSVTRAGSGTAHEVTVTGTPVVVSGQCDQSSWPWNCPAYAGGGPDEEEWIGMFNFIVSDYGAWTDAAQRESFYGMNYFNNVAATSVPPEITSDPTTGDPVLLIRMANRHWQSDGTVVKGHGELRIPNAFLQEVYGIPDPPSMTGSGLLPSLSGGGTGTVTAAQEAGNGAMLVTYDKVTFSARKLRIETGLITPTRPRNVEATRTAARAGTVTSAESTSRGDDITGYVAKCTPVRGGDSVAKQSDTVEPFVRMKGLRAGKKYDCRMAALSNAGASKWSDPVRMAGQPS